MTDHGAVQPSAYYHFDLTSTMAPKIEEATEASKPVIRPDIYMKQYEDTRKLMSRRNLPPIFIPDEISNRVWIGDLFRETPIRQLLSAVRGVGGIVDVIKMDIKAPMPDGQPFLSYRMCLGSVVFANNESARAFLEFVRVWGVNLCLEGYPSNNSTFIVRDRTPGMPGFAYAYPIARTDPSLCANVELFTKGFTRVLSVSSVPITSVCFLLTCVGMREVIHADYDKETAALDVEFTSIRAAVHAKNRLLELGMPYWQSKPIFTDNPGALRQASAEQPMVTFVKDPCDGQVDDLLEAPAYTPFISDDEVDCLNCLPYSIDWPANVHPCMKHGDVEPRNAEEQWDMLKSCDFIYRHGWSWNVPSEMQEIVECMQATIGTLEWNQTWDRWFREEAEHSNNLSRLHAYAEVVKHRQRMGSQCDGNCEYGCDLKNSPVAEVVQDYIAGNFEPRSLVDEDGSMADTSGTTTSAVGQKSDQSFKNNDDENSFNIDDAPPSVEQLALMIPVAKYRAHVKMKAEWGLKSRSLDNCLSETIGLPPHLRHRFNYRWVTEKREDIVTSPARAGMYTPL